MLIVGIDWAKSKHDIQLMDDQGNDLGHHRIEHCAHGIEQLAQLLSRHHEYHHNEPTQIRIAIEMHDGALLCWLIEQGYTVFGINPKAAKRARERYRPGGGKNDKFDAFVLADMLRTDNGTLHAIDPQSERTVELRQLVELRDKRVQERTACLLRMGDRLGQWCPALAGLCNDLTLNWQRDLLKRYPLQQDLHAMHRNTQRAFVRKHHLRDDTAARIADAAAATPWPIPQARQDALRLDIEYLLEQIEHQTQAIKRLDKLIAEKVDAHPDAALFRSLPVKADNTVAHLLAGFGDNHECSLDHQCLAVRWGAAPLTIQSGKSRYVQRRWTVSDQTIAQALLHFAFNTVNQTDCWASHYYRRKRNQGKDHYTTLRCLVKRWLKILTRMWKERAAYDEQKHKMRCKQQAAFIPHP